MAIVNCTKQGLFKALKGTPGQPHTILQEYKKKKNATKPNHKKTTKNTFGIDGADQREAGRDLFFRILTTREKQSKPDIAFLKQSSVIQYLNQDQNLYL